MIWDSWPWKKDLLQRAKRLERRRSQKRWLESSSFRTEQDVFFSAFGIRKLIEADKLSDEMESIAFSVASYRAKGKAVHLRNWDRIEELYDLDMPELEQRLSLKDFCDQIIHSFVFVLFFHETGGLGGFLFASDRAKQKRIYLLEIGSLITALTRIGQDDVVSSRSIRDASGQWVSVEKLSPNQTKKMGLPIQLSQKQQAGLREYIKAMTKKDEERGAT